MAWNPQSMITFHGTTPWIYSDTVWIACWLLSVEQFKVWINKDVFGLILEWNSSIVCYWSGERCYDEKSSVNIFSRTCLHGTGSSDPSPVLLSRFNQEPLSHIWLFDTMETTPLLEKVSSCGVLSHSVLEIIALGGTQITWQHRLIR